MGLINEKSRCAVCNIGAGRIRIANKEYICTDCYKKCGFNALTPVNKMTVPDIKDAINNQKINAERLSVFNPTKKIGSYIEFDDNNKLWLIPGIFGRKRNQRVYSYSDIIDFDLLEDGESITKGGLGRSVAGGLLFGGVGAIVGGITGGKKSKSICTSMMIKITVNDPKNPAVYINLITTSTMKNSFMYKQAFKSAQECLSTLQLICNNQAETKAENNSNSFSSADEILKYKNLLDQGIITQEEFEAKKKQLLGL